MQKWSLRYRIHQKLNTDLDVEVFTEKSDPSVPFERRETEEAPAFFDDYLPHHPVYLLKLGESFLLRLELRWASRCASPITEFVSVTAKAPDVDDQISLRMHQTIEKGSATALIFFDPKQILSGRLNSISPAFGLTDRKYVQVDIHTKVQLGDRFVPELALYHSVYCKIVRPSNRLRVYKWLGMLVTKEEIHRRQRQARDS